MGVDTRRPPLPAPTEEVTSMEGTDMATDLSRRTDHTSISIPEDGSPITIPTTRLQLPKEGRPHHGRKNSQTSLLIEYFEGSKKGEKSRSKPSVRVKVTPSSARRARTSGEAIQVSTIGSDRKPSYTRRISLGSKSENVEKVIIDGTDISRSTDSNGSGRPPVEVELINGSDMSNSHVSRDLRYLENTSDISAMPPDSLVDGAPETITTETVTDDSARPLHRKRSRSLERTTKQETIDHLDAPARTRSLSRDRITRKVMEKLAGKTLEGPSRRNRGVEYEPDTKPGKERRRRSSRTHHNDETITPDSSQLSAGLTTSQNSYRSGASKVSLNNPRLLEMVEDTVRRVIIPELQNMRNEQKIGRNHRDFEDSRRPTTVTQESYTSDLGRTVSKSSSTPNIRGKPKVVLNRYEDEPGHVLSRGDSERREKRRSSRDSGDSHSRRRRSSRSYSIDEERANEQKDKKSHGIRNAAAGALAGGILTAAALKHHTSKEEGRKDRRRHHSGRHSRSNSVSESTERIYDPASTDQTYDQTGSYQTYDQSVSDRTDNFDSHGNRIHGGRVHGGRLHNKHHLRNDPPHGDRIYEDEFDTETIDDRRSPGRRLGRDDVHGEEVLTDRTSSGFTGRDHHDRDTSDITYDDDSVEQTHRHGTHHRSYIPFTGGPTDSEMTRDSILSASTERPLTEEVEQIHTPVRHVNKGSVEDVRYDHDSPSTRTPVPGRSARNSISETSYDESIDTTPKTAEKTHSKSRTPALLGAAAGLGGIAAYQLGKHRSDKKHGTEHYEESVSPVQGVSSFRNDLNDPLMPQALHTQSSISALSGKHRFSGYTNSPLSSPGLAPSDGRVSPLAPDVDSFASRAKRSSVRPHSDTYGDATPRAMDQEDWLEEEHQKNERLRQSIASDSVRDSYLEDPRASQYTTDSITSTNLEGLEGEQDAHVMRSNPKYVHHPDDHPAVAESAVASLVDPSTISSSLLSSNLSTAQSTHDRHVGGLGGRLTELHHASPAPHEIEAAQALPASSASTSKSATLLQSIPRKAVAHSPRHSDTEFEREQISPARSTPIQLGASGVPDFNDPGPEIGYGLDSRSSKASLLSDRQAPISVKESRERFSTGAASPARSGRDFSFEHNDDESVSSRGHGHMKPLTAAAAGLAAGAAVGGLAARKNQTPSIHSNARSDLIEDDHHHGNLLATDKTRSPSLQSISRPMSVEDRYDEVMGTTKGSRSPLMQHGSRPVSVEDRYDEVTGAAMGSRSPLAQHTSRPQSMDDLYEREIRTGERVLSPSTRNAPRQASVEDEYTEDFGSLRPAPLKSPPKPTITPTNGPLTNDEGYVSGAYGRSVGTPANAAEPEYSNEDLAEYEAAMGNDDPFTNVKHAKHLSGNSHGMESPLYDSATGHGMDRIQSKDVVALMDHLTVRDGHRNARDTEILVTLVRSASEMRQQFEEMKRFIAKQDRMIMSHTDHDADKTVQKILQGQRQYQPKSSPQLSRPTTSEQASISTKKPNVFKKALKGLSGSSSGELAKIEGMLNQLLDDVEYLKEAQAMPVNRGAPMSDFEPSIAESRKDSVSSYEALRAQGDSGYEPSGLNGTGSTPNQSGTVQFSPPPKTGFHSGYDGRRDSINRVSTVLEDDEDDDGYEREEQLTPKPTAAQRAYAADPDTRRSGMIFGTPPAGQSSAERSPEETPERRHKHKSSTSSTFVPKVSRWSKTTASSGGDGLDSRRQSREQRPLSDASLGGQSQNQRDTYYDDYSDEASQGRPTSQRSIPRSAAHSDGYSARSSRSDLDRTPSPLAPATASRQRQANAHSASSSPRLNHPRDEDDEYIEDFKFVPVRDSLLLQHPQPVSGDGKRRGSNLESQAHSFQHTTPSIPGTGSDLSTTSVASEFDPSQWGSNPVLSLARAQKLGRINPDIDREPRSPARQTQHQATRRTAPTAAQDDGPLLPIQRHSPAQEDSASNSSEEDDNMFTPHPTGLTSHANTAITPQSGSGSSSYGSSSGGKSRDKRGSYERSSAPPRSFERHYYSSPLGSGHLLEPIEEVRYSLETDGGRTPTPKAFSHRGSRGSRGSRDLGGGDGLVDMRASLTPSPGPGASPGSGGKLRRDEPVRKITGPRPMSGGFLRKVVGGRA